MGHICFFNTAIAWGGGEKWHFEVSRYLHTKGVPVVVFAHKKSALYQKLIATKIPSEPITISNLSFLNPFAYRALERILGKYQIDTIVMNLSQDLKIAGPCAKGVKIPNIIYRRGSAIPIKNTFLNRYYFKNVLTGVLANSVATKHTILEHNKTLFPEEKINIIHNGIEIPENIEEALQKRKNGEEPFILLNLGRLEEQKNQKFLIGLAKELHGRQLKFKMLIGGEGRLREELQKSITEYQLDDKVELCGFIEQPLEFIQKCDVFLLPSLWEGFGYVLAEAALCKKPIVAFNLSSNPELVIDNKTGFLVPPQDLMAFSDAIVQLQERPEMRKKMGKAGFEHVLKNFDKKKQLSKIETYLLDGK